MSSQQIVTAVNEYPASSQSVSRQFAAAFVLGLVVLYGVAFAESPTLHNAAHDVRHIAVKPCH